MYPLIIWDHAYPNRHPLNQFWLQHCHVGAVILTTNFPWICPTNFLTLNNCSRIALESKYLFPF